MLLFLSDTRGLFYQPFVSYVFHARSLSSLSSLLSFLVSIGSERCGKDFGDAHCSDGLCCSAWGFCGTGGAWCDFGCQSQCWTESDVSGRPAVDRCGAAVGGGVCHGTYCCSSSGHCGSTSEYCEIDKGCQSQCWGGTAAAAVSAKIPEECKGDANLTTCLGVGRG